MINFKRSALPAIVGMVCGLGQADIALADSENHTQLAYAEITMPVTAGMKNSRVQTQRQELEELSADEKAFKTLRAAALDGSPDAQYALGLLYSDDDDQEQALFWLKRAVDQGHQQAKFSYNYILNEEDDVELGC